MYRKKLDRLESVYLTDAIPPRIRAAIPREDIPAEEQTAVSGTLRALHLDKNWLELALEDGSHMTCYTLPEMLDDVVGPMVNHQLVVTGRRRQRRGRERMLVQEMELSTRNKESSLTSACSGRRCAPPLMPPR